jgi:hypothetical protein
MEAEYWLPDEEDTTEEGFAYFRDIWLTLDTPIEHARAIASFESEVLPVLDALATNEREFEELARAIERGGDDNLGESLRGKLAEYPVLAEAISLEESYLDGLDFGISGLVHTLSAVGFLMAASCRGHREGGWSSEPVVFFATDEHNARARASVIDGSGFRFAIGVERENLLALTASSIKETIEVLPPWSE